MLQGGFMWQQYLAIFAAPFRTMFLMIFLLNGCSENFNDGSTDSCQSSQLGRVSLGTDPNRAEDSTISVGSDLSVLSGRELTIRTDGSCNLKNEFVKMSTTFSFFPSSLVKTHDDLSSYSLDSPEFRQVNAYYWSNVLRDRVAQLGGSFKDLTINANCKFLNGAWISTNGYMCLGVTSTSTFGYKLNGKGCVETKTLDSTSLVWASDDADAIVHEAGHRLNHSANTYDRLSSSAEAGAIDESLADYWAHTINNSPSALASWFLDGVDAYTNIFNALTPSEADEDCRTKHLDVRNALADNHYPEVIVDKVHRDSKPLTEVLWEIRTELGATITDELVYRTLTALTASPLYYKHVYPAMESAAIAQDLTTVQINTIKKTFTDKGLLRENDSLETFQLSTNSEHEPMYILTCSIENGVFDFDTCTQDRNADGDPVAFFYTGDTNKVTLVLLNPESSAGALGLVESTLVTTGLSNGVEIPVGGEIGTYFRLDGSGADFVDTFDNAGRDFTVKNSIDAIFLMKFTSAGVKDFTTKITSMSGHKKDINFSVTVVEPPN